MKSTQERNPGKRRGWAWGLGLLLALILALLLYFSPWQSRATKVVVETITLAPATRVLAVNGRIEALQSVELRPLVSGKLSDILVAEGQAVAHGADLAKIDPQAQQAVVRQAVAALDAALVSLDEAKATYQRTEALGQDVPRATLENAERAVRAAEHEVSRMTAILDQAQIQLGNFTIRAPIAGTVLVVNADLGQIIDPSTSLMTIADLTQLLVETDVDEAYATQIRVGQPAVLQLAGDTTVRDGHVNFVSQRVDEATGGLAVKLDFEQPVTAPIGLTVTANIVVDQQPSALTVPRAAVASDGDGTAVFLLADGIAVRRQVEVIDWPAARLIVTSGLQPGDKVIADATGIADGQVVAADQP